MGHGQRFNSTMVRLKETRQYKAELSLKFQFHYGSIKGILPPVMVASLMCFNSTMVRLKVPKGLADQPGKSRFNSTMVRLKGYTVPQDKAIIMVSIPLWFD